MRLKLLFFPVALVVSIVIAIWYIKPEFSAVQNNKLLLQEKNQRKESLQKKMANIESLSSDLESNSEYEKIVLEYVPKEAYIERIIDNVNYLAGDMLGVSLINIGLNGGKNSTNSTASDQADIAANKHGFVLDDLLEGPSQSGNVRFNDISLAITIAGRYENVKNYLKQIRMMRHMNEIESVSLSAVSDSSGDLDSGEGAEAAPLEKESLVQAGITVSFKYLPFSPYNAYYVLNKEKFDYSAIDRLKDGFQGGVEVPEIVVGGRGKANPFE